MSTSIWNRHLRESFVGAIHTLMERQTIIDYIQISTLGNAIDFGDMSLHRQSQCSSSCKSNGEEMLIGSGYY